MNNGKIGLDLNYLSVFLNIKLNDQLIIKYMSVLWANHLSGRVLPSVECPVSVIAKPRPRIRSKNHTNKRKINFQLIL
jgi:hypothetical protein